MKKRGGERQEGEEETEWKVKDGYEEKKKRKINRGDRVGDE